MDTLRRLRRYARLARSARSADGMPSFLVLFVNSVCNMKCDHCFYWRHLNGRDDLRLEEFVALSRSLGTFENLSLSGGEPFIRRDLAEICRQFVRRNGVREINIPSNGYFTDRIVATAREILREADLRLVAVELSLDGMPAFHDEFRGTRRAFEKAMLTYDALAQLQEEDSRLRIQAISTANATTMGEIRRLSTFLYDRCPRMEHHNLAMIRGDRRNPMLAGPELRQYYALYEYIRRLWAPRERGRFGGSVEPMLQWAKVRTMTERKQFVPCTAGRLSAVVYANGDVGVCEQLPPIGNLRQHSFAEIWTSDEARRLRQSIARRECYCTTEVFIWQGIVYQPLQLLRAAAGSGLWPHPAPLPASERVDPAHEDGRALAALRAARLEAARSVHAR